jgi:hypothetical protein
MLACTIPVSVDPVEVGIAAQVPHYRPIIADRGLKTERIMRVNMPTATGRSCGAVAIVPEKNKAFRQTLAVVKDNTWPFCVATSHGPGGVGTGVKVGPGTPGCEGPPGQPGDTVNRDFDGHTPDIFGVQMPEPKGLVRHSPRGSEIAVHLEFVFGPYNDPRIGLR